jgi:arginine utilization protein RocB
MERAPERREQSYDWYATVRDYMLRLVGISSVSPGSGERAVAEEALRILREGGLADAYLESGLDPLPGDPYGRANTYALLRGASPHTVVLLGHIDTVGTSDYGPLEPWALDPHGLAERRDALAALAPELRAVLDLYPGDVMLGRGVADMKSGVAVNLAVMRALAREAQIGTLPISVVVLATPDEENESTGVLRAVRLMLRLRAEHGLEYIGAINTDTILPRVPGDERRYVYTGTVGKLLPSFLVLGREAHVGTPFAGVDANLIVAELVRDLSMNPALCDVVRGQATPPPVTLHAADLKDHYDVQLPFAAAFYLNVLTFATTPGELLERLLGIARPALERVLARLDARELEWRRLGDRDVDRQDGGFAEQPPRSGVVLTYAELYRETAARLGEVRVRALLSEEGARLPADLDARERSLWLVQRLWAESGRSGPAIVLYYSPPYYPHVAARPGALHAAVAAVAQAHPELNLTIEEFYPYISDMSYLRLDPNFDVAALAANLPQWREPQDPPLPGAYTLPFEAIRALDMPFVDLGPFGGGVHQRGEWVLASYSFGVVPQLVYEAIGRLGAGENGA